MIPIGRRAGPMLLSMALMMFAMGVVIGGSAATEDVGYDAIQENITNATTTAVDDVEANASGVTGQVAVIFAYQTAEIAEMTSMWGASVGYAYPGLAKPISWSAVGLAFASPLWFIYNMVRRRP